MSERTWDSVLVADHEMIERAMDILKNELNKLPNSDLDSFVTRRTLDFLLEFGDGLHNKKEEKYLFPLLIKKGIPEDGPIRVMLLEHDSERELLTQMIPEIDQLSGDDEKEGFKAKGLEYLTTRAEHIWKENDVLYAMGRRAFGPEDNSYLLDGFDGIIQAAYGLEADDKIKQMLNEAEKGGQARKSLLNNLTMEQIDAVMETLPFEVTFVDADDTVAYFNRLDKDKIFVRTRSAVGRKVEQCHPEKSVDTVLKIVAGFKDGSMDEASFWIDFKGDKVLIRYFPVRNDAGEYMGVLEVTQEIGDIMKITGQKTLLD